MSSSQKYVPKHARSRSASPAPAPAPAPADGAPAPGAAAPATAEASGYLTHKQILVVLFGLLAGMLLAALDQSIVAVALPRIVSDLGGLNELSWVVTAYLLTSTASTPVWGKISDLYGRRPVFQSAIVIFLIGSVLSGFSANMHELIGFRAIQGMGAGGLMALAFAIIGDVIPPRERGRYQGYFGAVFGISSVAGPLLGGWLTDGPGWHWIFWLNVPIGAAALVITSVALKLPRIHHKAKVDWAGATLIVGSVSTLLLYLSWRGKDYGWTETWALVLVGAGLVLAVGFVIAEHIVAEPIIPMRLFHNRTFSVGNLFGFIMGFGMFGGIIYLPVYLQVVKGYSPTESGLAMLPMVLGIFTTSIGSGQLITKLGRYKIYPLLGGAILTIAMLLLSRLDLHSSMVEIGIFEFILGAGLGFSMQTITVAVQNAIERRDMGSATSAVTFFRSMGGAFGTAVFGSILTSRLATHLTDLLPAQLAAKLPAGTTDDLTKIAQLPLDIRTPVLHAFVDSIHDLFLSAAPIMLLAFLVAFLLKEIPLKTHHDGQQPPSGPADPGPSTQQLDGADDGLAAMPH